MRKLLFALLLLAPFALAQTAYEVVPVPHTAMTVVQDADASCGAALKGNAGGFGTVAIQLGELPAGTYWLYGRLRHPQGHGMAFGFDSARRFTPGVNGRWNWSGYSKALSAGRHTVVFGPRSDATGVEVDLFVVSPRRLSAAELNAHLNTTCPTPPDVQPPGAVTDLAVEAVRSETSTDRTTRITWTLPPDEDIAAVLVYVNGAPEPHATLGPVNEFSEPTTVSRVYQVAVQDDSDNVGPRSEPVSAPVKPLIEMVDQELSFFIISDLDGHTYGFEGTARLEMQGSLRLDHFRLEGSESLIRLVLRLLSP